MRTLLVLGLWCRKFLSGSQIVLTDFEPAAALTVTPESLTVIRGNLSSGTFSELTERDISDVSVRRIATDVQSRTQIEMAATSPVRNPTSMRMQWKVQYLPEGQ